MYMTGHKMRSRYPLIRAVMEKNSVVKNFWEDQKCGGKIHTYRSDVEELRGGPN